MRLFVFGLLACVALKGQTQVNQALDQRHGFKDIKLLSRIGDYPGLEFSKEMKDKPGQAVYKAKKGYYRSIGDVPVSKLLVYTYRDLIYRIEVTAEKNEKLFRSLEKAFGKIRYSVGSQVSYWEGARVRLTYRPEGKRQVKLTYLSKEINKIMAEDRQREIDSLTSEF